MQLYLYEHCPYCIKAQMIFGLKNIPYNKIIIMEDDEVTPTKLVGHKVVPILEKNDGSCMPESMDIVHYVDAINEKPIIVGNNVPAIAQWLAEHKSTINNLLYPRFANLPFPELDSDSAHTRYVQRMTAKIGDLNKLLRQTPHFLAQLHTALDFLDSLIISPDAVNGILSEDDFHLFANLHLLTSVKDIIFPEKVRIYIETLSQKTQLQSLSHIAI